MNTQRTFIAIEFPARIHQALDELIRSYKQHPLQAVRWVPTKNIHLTLRFLGDTTPQQITLIKQSIQSITGQFSPFDVNIEGSGVFPNLKRPRVLWVAAKAPDSLLKIQTLIEESCRQAGFTAENRPFSPHLTLGRVSPNATRQEIEALTKALQAVKVGQIGSCKIDRLTFFKSDLNPAGAVYSPLAYFPLNAA